MIDFSLKDEMINTELNDWMNAPMGKMDASLNIENHTFNNFKSLNKGDLIKRILFDISQADFNKKEFDPIIKILQEMSNADSITNN